MNAHDSAALAAAGTQGAMPLPPGARLQEFEIVSVIGQGGFGIVYLARDLALHRTVAIKEYMPAHLAGRDRRATVLPLTPASSETFELGRRGFLEEARMLARFKHPGLLEVLRFWEQHGTAYMVMPYYDGATLTQHLKRNPGIATEAWLKQTLRPLIDALEHMHAAQCCHRDVAPDNILVMKDGTAVLLDLGAARRAIADNAQAMTVMLKPGFAPIEQYSDDPRVHQGPWTDIYALAAVLYFCLTGKPPPASATRVMRDSVSPLAALAPAGFSAGFLAAIDQGLSLQPEDRPRTIAQFRALLYGDAPPDLASAANRRTSTWRAIAAAALSSGARIAAARTGPAPARPPAAAAPITAAPVTAAAAAPVAAAVVAAIGEPACATAAAGEAVASVAGAAVARAAGLGAAGSGAVVDRPAGGARTAAAARAAGDDDDPMTDVPRPRTKVIPAGASPATHWNGFGSGPMAWSGSLDSEPQPASPAGAGARATAAAGAALRRIQPYHVLFGIGILLLLFAFGWQMLRPATPTGARDGGPVPVASGVVLAPAGRAVEPASPAGAPDTAGTAGTLSGPQAGAQPGSRADALPGFQADAPPGPQAGAAPVPIQHPAPDESTVKAPAGASADTPVNPVPVGNAQVLLAVKPWAEVRVDGVVRGVTPPVRQLTLPAGKHVIELRNPSAPPVRKTITVKAGERVVVGHLF
ncbi:MAG: protein kinase [Lautropia sp.]